jgi:hypothetical protein
MNDKRRDEDLIKQAKTMFGDSVDRLDAETVSRLNRGRQAALAELDRSRLSGQWARWVPATGIAAAAVVAVVVWQGSNVEGTLPANGSVADFELLLGEDSLEMIEDLEFYSWIEPSDFETNGNVG